MGGWKKVDLHRGEFEAGCHPLTLIVQVSPLELACYCGKTEFALSLLRAGASPDSPSRRSDGRLSTPLCNAATHPDISGGALTQALIAAGATVGLGVSPLERRDKMKPEVLKMITGAKLSTSAMNFKIVKCLKGHRSQGSLFNVKNQKWLCDSLSE